MATEVERLHVTILAQTKQFERSLKKIERQTGTMATKSSRNFRRMDRAMNRSGRAAKRLGSRVGTLGGILIGVGNVAAGKAFVGFEDSMTKITALVGVSADQVSAWKDELLALAPAVAKGPQELADAMFFITSAGLRGKEAMAALTAAAKGSSAGLGETKDVADAATSAMNAYGAANLSASKATGILVAAVREGKAEASEIGAAIGAVIPIASEMGVRFDEVSAAIATMTRLGLDSANSVTALKAILSSILKPGTQARDAFKEMGLSIDQLRRSLREDGLLKTLQLLKKSIGTNQDALGRAIPNVRAVTGFLALMGKNAATTEEIFNSLAKSGTPDLDKAFNTMAETSKFKLNVALAEMNVILTDLGEQTIPIFVDALGFIRDGFAFVSKEVKLAKIDLEAWLAIAKEIAEHGVFADIASIRNRQARAAGRITDPQFPGERAVAPIGGDVSRGRVTPAPVPTGGLGESVDGVTKAISGLKNEFELIEQVGSNVADSLTDAFSTLAEGGKVSFKDMVRSMLSDLNRLLLNKLFTQVIGSLIGGATGTTLTGSGVRIPNFTTTVSAPGRAGGGMVRPGRAFTVGEKGRETFVPNSAGRIEAGGSKVEINIQSPAGFQGEAQERQESGIKIVDVIFSTVNKGMAEGKFDASMGARFGARSRTARR